MKALHRPTTKNLLQHLIRQQHPNLHPRQPLLQCYHSPLSTSTNHIPHTNHRLQQHAKILIVRLEQYQKYYGECMKFQMKKYVEYYGEISKIVEEEMKIGMFRIQRCYQRMGEMFRSKKKVIEQLVEELSYKQQWRKVAVQDKLNQFNRQMSLDIQLLDIKLPDLTTFRTAINPYTMNPPQQLQPQPVVQLVALQRQEQGVQTDEMEELQEQGQVDSWLGCDEEMSGNRKLTASAKRRRKYAVGGRDVIKEEEESSSGGED